MELGRPGRSSILPGIERSYFSFVLHPLPRSNPRAHIQMYINVEYKNFPSGTRHNTPAVEHETQYVSYNEISMFVLVYINFYKVRHTTAGRIKNKQLPPQTCHSIFPSAINCNAVEWIRTIPLILRIPFLLFKEMYTNLLNYGARQGGGGLGRGRKLRTARMF